MDFSAWTLQSPELHVRQNVAELNPAPSPSGHPLLSGPPNFGDIPQIFTTCDPKLRSALLDTKWSGRGWHHQGWHDLSEA